MLLRYSVQIYSLVMVTPPNEWKILERDEKLQTNKHSSVTVILITISKLSY